MIPELEHCMISSNRLLIVIPCMLVSSVSEEEAEGVAEEEFDRKEKFRFTAPSVTSLVGESSCDGYSCS